MSRERDYEVDLGDGMKAIIRVKFEGQQPPDKGDNVVSSVVVFLPSKDGLLDPRLQFGYRLSILGGKRLHDTFGSYDEDMNMVKSPSYYFNADTVEDAIRLAKEWAFEEVGKLKQALDRRREAYEKALGEGTLYGLLKDQLPGDIIDYTILSPSSLDDQAIVIVKVKSSSGEKTITLNLCT